MKSILTKIQNYTLHVERGMTYAGDEMWTIQDILKTGTDTDGEYVVVKLVRDRDDYLTYFKIRERHMTERLGPKP